MIAQPTAFDVFVARQPIFDLAQRRVAYELLYRATAAATTARGIDTDAMCNDTALHSLVSIGLDRLTGGSTAYVNVTREHLVGELFRVFDADSVVLELLESVDGDDAVILACERALADGYMLALDDYDGRSSLDPLLTFASVVKLDVLGRTEQQLAPTIARLKNRGITVLAERVETVEELERWRRAGCDLFQGYVFSRPETMDGRTLSVNDTAILRILAMAQDPAVGDSQLEDAFRSHPSLSHTLLRIVKSAAFGVSNVESIAHAIRVVGRATLSRWLMVMLVGSIATRNPVSHEAVLQALVRARFCEMLPVETTGGSAARFLVGMLSRMDALLGQTMEDVLQRLPVAPEVQEALLVRGGVHGDVLRLAEAYERGEWDGVTTTVVGRMSGTATLADIYGEATQWALERLQAG